MANITLILGPTGTGKSTSIETLNPKETVIFSVAKNKLPFAGSSKLYNRENENFFKVETAEKIIAGLLKYNTVPHIKNIIIDDITYVMRKEYFASANKKGYDKFVDIAAHFQSILSTAENLRDDINVILMMHCEEVFSDGAIVGYKPSTIGKLIDSTYNPMEVVNVLLMAIPKVEDNGNIEYGFYTNRKVYNGVLIPAKSPKGMFSEEFVPNDLQAIINTMNDYYGI